MGELIELAAWRCERRRRERQERCAAAVAREVVRALAIGDEPSAWWGDPVTLQALCDLVAEQLKARRPDLFGDEINAITTVGEAS